MEFLSIIIGIAFIIGLAVLFLKIVDRFTIGSNSPKARAKAARQFEARLVAPNFAELEQRYGCDLPKSLKHLFSDAGLVLANDLEVSGQGGDSEGMWHIAWFYPMDSQDLNDAPFDSLKYLAIADDGFGNCYVIDPKLEDPAVQFFDLETGEFSDVADHLSVLVAQVKLQTTPN